MRVALLTREYPPAVYGGAGVHVTYLARELAAHVDVDVHAIGAGSAGATWHEPWAALDGEAALRWLSADLTMAAAVHGAELVHSHTWYANLAGHLAGLLHGVPHLMTAHSLEPLRPWKAEQLGGGYAVSSWCERTAAEAADAIIAVSADMRRDVLAAYPAVDPARVHVIHNGIDTAEYHADEGTDALATHGIDPSVPSVVFVGRITEQKGVAHLLAAAAQLDARAQLVLCAGAPDTPALAARVRAAVAALRSRGTQVVWIEGLLPRRDLLQVLTHATVFVCPSIYEPFGLVNLEAMACETPVVASAVGGIPEVVVHGETGVLVPFTPDASPASRRSSAAPAAGRAADRTGPPEPEAFATALAAAIDELLADPARAQAMGQAGRRRVVEHFSWPAVARATAELYAELC